MLYEREKGAEDFVQVALDKLREQMAPPFYLDENDNLASDAEAAGGGRTNYGSLAREEVERRKNNKMRKNWWTPVAGDLDIVLFGATWLDPGQRKAFKAELNQIITSFRTDMSQGDKRVKRADVEQLENLGRRVIVAVEVARKPREERRAA